VRIGERPSATAYLLSQERLIRGNLEEAFEYGPYRTYQVSVRRIEKLTGLDFNELSEYDGFSGEEAVGPEQISEIADWEQIRL
jgi:endonuclease G